MSQPGTQGQPEPLNQAEQQQLIQEIGRVILRSLPPGWAEASLEYRAIGAHDELAAQLIAPNGTAVALAAPAEARGLFGRLRHGMHQQDRGTWLSALYRLQRPSSYSVDFNGDYEPVWQTPPPAAEFAEELRRYPRAGTYIPGWLSERVKTASADAPAFRKAEIFDGTDAAGRPVTNRPPVRPEDRERVVDYLERAPVVLAARSYDTDQLAPDGTPAVPVTFHTDGSWIWPGAVGYYLRRHNVPPEADLLEHIRRLEFRLPDVDERTRELAASVITRESR
jgi:hypothetical protein